MEESLMDDCKNWGSIECNNEVGKWKYSKKLKPGENMPIRPVAFELKRLDEICAKCEAREFIIQEKICPICRGTTCLEINGPIISVENIKKNETIYLICENCITRLLLNFLY